MSKDIKDESTDAVLWRVYATAYNASEPVSLKQQRSAHTAGLRAVAAVVRGEESDRG